jgi:glycerol kinase
MSLKKVFGKTMLCAALGASLLAGVATPANADRDDACRRQVRKAEENLNKAVRKHGERSRQAEERRRQLEEARRRCHGEERHEHH